MDVGSRAVTGLIGFLAGVAIGGGMAEGLPFLVLIGGNIALTGWILRYTAGLK